MTPIATPQATNSPVWRRPGSLALLASLALALLACGGGGVEGQGTGSTPGFSQGAISGFGSVIVNGVRFDDTNAKVKDDDGQALGRDLLKLGMVVSIDSGPIDQASLTAVARAITVGSEQLGPVTANDVAAGRLVVLGQTVVVTATTVFDERLAGGQAGIALGSAVEVYALLDPVSGQYVARRIEPESSPGRYKIRGVVSANNVAARSFRIGTETFTYAAGAAPANLADGALLKVQVATSRNGSGQWVVNGFSSGATPLPPNGAEVEIESVISRFASLSDFTVAGIPVNASAARLEPTGAVLVAGSRVELEGVMQSGVLVASKVELKDESDDDDGGGDDGTGTEFEIQGRITSINSSLKTFVVRGVTISYAGSVVYEGGAEADLAVDEKVEVKGVLSADGTVVVAEEIKFDD